MDQDVLSSRALVFAGGQFNKSDLDGVCIDTSDLIVGVDHGIEHCLACGLIPDIILGDFDSVEKSTLNNERVKQAEVIGYDARKNFSDLELALLHLEEKSVASVTLFGISGGRTDHHLFNWLLPFHKQWPYSIELVDSTVHAHLVSAQYPLSSRSYCAQTVSLLPMPQATGVCTTGLEYPLTGATLTMGSTRGLSNVATGSAFGVTVKEGQLLVFRVRAE